MNFRALIDSIVPNLPRPSALLESVLGEEEIDLDLYRRSFTRVVETGLNAALRVENRNGLISVRSHDRPEVVINVTAELYAGSSADADFDVERIQRAIVASDERVEIITPELRGPELMFFGRGSKVDYEILAPAACSLNASSRNGRVDVERVRGPVDVRSRNGGVSVDQVTERVWVEAGNGRVVVRRAGGEVVVSGHNGSVSLEQVSGRLSVGSTNGTVEIRDAHSSIKASSTNGGIRYRGPVQGDFEMSTTNGGIRLSIPAASRFEVDAESRHGSVSSDLPVRGAPPEGGPLPRVRLRTTNGSIRLEAL
jgi:hypothetical protein